MHLWLSGHRTSDSGHWTEDVQISRYPKSGDGTPGIGLPDLALWRRVKV